jgi:Xaa-Pro dipeptidase
MRGRGRDLTDEDNSMEFTTRERDRRYKAVRSRMEKQGLDGLIVYGTTGVGGRWNGNFVYLADRCLFYGDALMFFSVDEDPIIFISGENQYLEAKRTPWISDIRMTRQPAKDLCAHLKSRKSGKRATGVSSFAGLPAEIVQLFRAQLPDAELTEASELVFAEREIKSGEELLAARQGGEVADAGFRRSLEIIRPGVSEFEWRAELENVMTKGGADGGFNMIGAGRPDGDHDPFRGFVMPPTERKFQKGDLLALEITPRAKGYWNQLVRLVSLGEPPAYIKKAHAACLDAKHAAYDKLRPGGTFTAVAKALNDALIKHGYTMKGIGSAHTAGLDLSESFINLDNPRRVEAGFLVTIHPMVATGEWRQLFIGETCFVHADRLEMLNKADEAIAVLD